MENQSAFFSTRIDKLVVLTRVLRRTAQSQRDINTTIINKILFSNLEDVLLVINNLRKNEETGIYEEISIDELFRRVRAIKNETAGLNREDKKARKVKDRLQLANGMQNEPKIKLRYFRGYPLKDAA